MSVAVKQDNMKSEIEDENDDNQQNHGTGGGGGGGGGAGRKRNNDAGNTDFGSPQKKIYISGNNDAESVYLKFLVPQVTAGSVIGKGGANISELQREYEVHIRMSKANDVFPGTDSRVALMSGNASNVHTATMVIFKRMTSPSDLFPKNPRPKNVSDREISLVVPQSTAGLIIGKGGSRVKSIQEESNCHINLTQKSDQLPSNERVVTIQNNDNNIENLETALRLILDIIKNDPSSGSCLMINYSGSVGGERGHHNRRDDYHEDYYEEPPPPRVRQWDRGAARGDMHGPVGGGRGNDLPTGGGNAASFSVTGFPPQVHFWCTFSGPPISNSHTPPPLMLEGMKQHLLNVGYPPKATQEIISASNILASYGVLKPGNIGIFNIPAIQAQTVNPFNTMTGNGSDSIGLGALNPMGGNGSSDGWNNSGMGGGGGGGQGMFMNKFGGGGVGGGLGGVGVGNRPGGFGGAGGGGNFMGGMGGGGGGMNSGGGGFGKNDMHDKRRF